MAKQRTAKQKAATRKMLAANRAARGGKRKSRKGGAKRTAKRSASKRTSHKGHKGLAARVTKLEAFRGAQQKYNVLTEARFGVVKSALSQLHQHNRLSTPSSLHKLASGR